MANSSQTAVCWLICDKQKQHYRKQVTEDVCYIFLLPLLQNLGQMTGRFVAFVRKDVTPEDLEELVKKEVTKLKILHVRNYLTKSLDSFFVRSK